MLLRGALLRAAASPSLRRGVTAVRPARAVALRFVAGESAGEGFAVARRLVTQGRSISLDLLGESVTNPEAARAAAGAYCDLVERMAVEGLAGGISVKPTQLGLALDEALAAELLAPVARATGEHCDHLTLDMEDSPTTEVTIRLVETLQAAGHGHVGCAVQSYLRRTRADIERLTAAGASLRLCKGAYAEPDAVAYQRRVDVDRNFALCARWLLEKGHYPRIATHDDRLLRFVTRYADRLGLSRNAYELQMLYGVRPALQEELVRAGYRLRVYVPFGSEWYPYFVRRLAERPANLVFFLRALAGG